MSRIFRVRCSFCLLSLLTALAVAPAFAANADGTCSLWDVPQRLIVRQWDGQYIAFDLEADGGGQFHGKASYQTTQRYVIGNLSGNITGDAFYARVLWTYSGVAAIGRYTGTIQPYQQVPAGQPQYGYVHAGDTYDEYGRSEPNYWSADRFPCHVEPAPPPPRVDTTPRFDDQKQDNAALATIAAEQNGVKAQGRVRVDGAPGTSKLTICESARAARARNSPAAPGLEQQCLASGGSLAPPPAAPPIAEAQLAELAAKGGPIAAADPLSVALRAQQMEGAGQLGFDIGMAAAENQTAPGPGKQHIHDSLPVDQQAGFDAAVAFSLERNRNRDLAAKGAAIVAQDVVVARARNGDANVFFWLGFDIATGIFGDPALGALGNTATGPGSLKIRDALSADAQRGFNAAVEHHLARHYGS